jgi:general secretion pathway protein G
VRVVDEHCQRDRSAATVRLDSESPRSPRAVLRLLWSSRGFSLIELLVVIIILGLVAGLVGPRLFGRVGQSKQGIAKAQIELFGAALDQYRLDVGSYPAGASGLQALVQNPNTPSWNGPYLKKNVVPLDPWGRPYQYKCCLGLGGADAAGLRDRRLGVSAV